MSEAKIATSESGCHLAHFRTLLEHQGASILNVDATICPGYEVAKDVADRAADRGLSIAPRRLPGIATAAGRCRGQRRVPRILPGCRRLVVHRDVSAHPETRRRRLRAEHGPAKPLPGGVIPNPPKEGV